MNRASGMVIVALLAGSAFAQTATRGFGSVVFPGGTAATNPNITRTFGSVVFPGGSPATPIVRSGPSIGSFPVYGSRPSSGFTGGNSFTSGAGGANRGRRTAPATVYSYPVYVPLYFDPALAGGEAQYQYAPQPVPVYLPPPQQQPQQPQQQEVHPMVMQFAIPPGEPAASEPDPDTAAPHFLIAFKDHAIYSVVAYWFDGDTLHYFTKADTHNQAPVALLDRELTQRLNREMGLDFRLPSVQ